MGSRVGSADADVAEAAGDAQGDGAGLVDAVVADPVVVCAAVAGPGSALGRCLRAAAGVARCGSERCGRWWL